MIIHKSTGLCLRSFFTGLIFVLATVAGHSQTFTADFRLENPDDSTGCGNHRVKLIPIPLGSDYTYQWRSGNGGQSTLPTPEFTYAPGSYTVKLVITNRFTGEKDSISKPGFIKVYSLPNPDFLASVTEGCPPLNVSFTDLTTGAKIEAWQWSFGNVQASTEQNPSVVYNAVGNYNVTLTVRDEHGCENTKITPGAITVKEHPDADFSMLPEAACAPPVDVTFTAADTNLNYTYSWDLAGIGTFSGRDIPPQRYTAEGSFPVTLIITGEGGCQDTVTRSVVIQKPVADFNAAVACKGQAFEFTSIHTGKTYSWNFGDGGTGSGKTVSHTYADTGTYTVTLTIASDSCSDVISKQVRVEGVDVDFFPLNPYVCEVPGSLTFTSLAKGAASVAWTTSDGTITPSPGDSIVSIEFTQESNPTVKLTATSPGGCVVSKQTTVKVKKPVARIAVDSVEVGCFPVEVSFRDTSSSDTTITSWSWTFGDDSVSSLQHPTHTYTNDSTFQVILVIENKLGCKATDTLEIFVGEHLHVGFELEQDHLCAWVDGKDLVHLKDRSYPVSDTTKTDSRQVIDYWKWKIYETDDTTKYTEKNDSAPSFWHEKTVGWQNIRLIVGYNGCRDTLDSVRTHYIFGPIIEAITPVDPPCGSKTMRFELDSIVDFRLLALDYGDGSRDTVYHYTDTLVHAITDPFTGDTVGYDTLLLSPDPSDMRPFIESYGKRSFLLGEHTYRDTGTYQIRITALVDTFKVSPFDPLDTIEVTCKFDTTIEFKIEFIDVGMLGADTLCAGNNSSVFRSTGNATSYQWFIDNRSVATTNNYTANSLLTGARGLYELMFVGANDQGCTDTAIKMVSVLQPAPVATHIFGDLAGCAPIKLLFTGADTGGVPIKRWEWSFGTNATPSASLLQNPDTVRYTLNGDYQVKLKVTDIFNCVNTYSFLPTIKVGAPTPSYFLSKPIYCSGETVSITNTSTAPSGSPQYTWIILPSDTFTTRDLAVPATQPGTYTGVLVMDMGNNCKAQTTFSYKVEGFPNLDFVSLKPQESECYPYYNVPFVRTDQGLPGDKLFWYPGNGENGSGDTAYATYIQVGKYTVKLVASSPSGTCVDSLIKTDYITVNGPVADVEVSDDNICLGENIIFRMINDVGVKDFAWEMGDGDSRANKRVTYFQPTVGGLDTIYLVMFSEGGGCEPRDTVIFYVTDVHANFTVTGAPPGFRPGIDTLRSCEFYNLEAILDRGTQGLIDSHTWLPEPGQAAVTDDTLRHAYGVGTHRFKLSVLDVQSGCTDEIDQWLIVYPPITAKAGPDFALCQGESVTLVGGPQVVGSSYAWSPADGLGRPDSMITTANPGSSVIYTLTVTDRYGCQATDQVSVFRDSTVTDFNISTKTACGSLQLNITNLSYANHYQWTFDNDGASTDAVPSFAFTSPGRHIVYLVAYDSLPRCSKSKRDTVEVFPTPLIVTIGDTVICLGDTMQLTTFTSANPLDSVHWGPFVNLSDSTALSPLVHPTEPTLYRVTISNSYCINTDSVFIYVDSARASFSVTQDTMCLGSQLTVVNNSQGKHFFWKFSNKPGHTSNQYDPGPIDFFFPGNYAVTLTVRDSLAACEAVHSEAVRVLASPVLQAPPDVAICNYDTLQLFVTGGEFFTWTPSYGLSDTTIRNPLAFPKVTTTYYVLAKDSFGCETLDSVEVEVLSDFTYNQPPLKDTIFVGDSISVNVIANAQNITYTWAPDYHISCTNCPNPTFWPHRSTCYDLRISDEKQCYPKIHRYCIIVDEEYVVNVPTAFSPNRDGINDRVYVRGLGIKKLLKFTIYNRWGEVVFETEDINVGWDGTYKEKLQNDETYVYVVNAEMYNGQVMTRNGYITLLK